MSITPDRRDIYLTVNIAEGEIAGLAGCNRYRGRAILGDGTVTLHRVLVHVTAETQRHTGHADIVRELVDGSAGQGVRTIAAIARRERT